uniref:C2H2-type domain-containing protein n=1 Tax=Eptatretus burgeri TaxID=7764 RepID=A0A8C4R0N0_EPTBU
MFCGFYPTFPLLLHVICVLPETVCLLPSPSPNSTLTSILSKSSFVASRTVFLIQLSRVLPYRILSPLRSTTSWSPPFPRLSYTTPAETLFSSLCYSFLSLCSDFLHDVKHEPEVLGSVHPKGLINVLKVEPEELVALDHKGSQTEINQNKSSMTFKRRAAKVELQLRTEKQEWQSSCVEPSMKMYKCRHCPSSFVSTTQMKLHLTTHTEKRHYKCYTCTKSFFHLHTINQRFSTQSNEDKKTGEGRKHRSLAAEGRKVQDNWKEKFAVIERDGKPFCLLCRTALNVSKTYNVKRHFETKHQDFETKYAEKPEDRKLRISNLEKSLNNEQKMLRTTFTGTYAMTLASYKISWMLAKQGKTFSDAALVKECFLEYADCLFNDLTNKNEIIRRIKNLNLSNDTVCRHISDLSENLSAQLKAKIAFFCSFKFSS